MAEDYIDSEEVRRQREVEEFKNKLFGTDVKTDLEKTGCVFLSEETNDQHRPNTREIRFSYKGVQYFLDGMVLNYSATPVEFVWRISKNRGLDDQNYSDGKTIEEAFKKIDQLA